MTSKKVERELRALGTPERARASAWFFKTGKGEYGHGDRFLGVSVPEQRNVARAHEDLSYAELEKLLASPLHECRLTALLILVRQYERAHKAKDARTCGRIAKFYLANRARVNNWDLVDLSASYILGRHLLDTDRRVLDRLAASKHLWDRRIAIVSTHAFIAQHDYEDTLRIAAMLESDAADLIHKATGWMLREVGKRSEATLRSFLDTHASRMPRTMLRYAIERLPAATRKRYLAK